MTSPPRPDPHPWLVALAKKVGAGSGPFYRNPLTSVVLALVATCLLVYTAYSGSSNAAERERLQSQLSAEVTQVQALGATQAERSTSNQQLT